MSFAGEILVCSNFRVPGSKYVFNYDETEKRVISAFQSRKRHESFEKKNNLKKKSEKTKKAFSVSSPPDFSRLNVKATPTNRQMEQQSQYLKGGPTEQSTNGPVLMGKNDW